MVALSPSLSNGWEFIGDKMHACKNPKNDFQSLNSDTNDSSADSKFSDSSQIIPYTRNQ